MKPLIKYISLLLFSGLILPFCGLQKPQTAFILSPKKTAQSTKAQQVKPMSYSFFICPEVLEMLFPMLKSEKSM